LTPDSIQQKYAQTVASTWITPSRLQFLGEKKRFHTAWVINGRYQLEMRRPLFPRKQTWIGPARAGKLGEFQRFSPGGLFGLSFNFLRMNQAHRS
jgi:hypothetical protein